MTKIYHIMLLHDSSITTFQTVHRCSCRYHNHWYHSSVFKMSTFSPARKL